MITYRFEDAVPAFPMPASLVDRITDEEPAPDDVLWNDVEHDERCCMDGTYRSPANGCPGVAELFHIEREDPSGDE